MASDKQIAANRANARKSTGPRTPEGKRKVALNPIKHGAYMNLANLRQLGERSGDLQRLHDSFRADTRPHGAIQEALVEQLAFAHFRIRRYTLQESLAFAENLIAAGNFAYALGRDHHISHSGLNRIASLLRSLHREFRESLRLLHEEQDREPDWLMEELEAREAAQPSEANPIPEPPPPPEPQSSPDIPQPDTPEVPPTPTQTPPEAPEPAIK